MDAFMETFHSLKVLCWQFQAVNLILPDSLLNVLQYLLNNWTTL